MKQSLQVLAEKLGCQLIGDSAATVTNVSRLQSAKSDSLVFVEDVQHLQAALRSPAAAVIAGGFTVANAPKPIIFSSQPRLTSARAARLLCDPETNCAIHPSAIVAVSAKIGKNVAIGPGAILGEQVNVGDETTIGAGAAIADQVVIGSHCRIDAHVTIYAGTTLGDRVKVQAGAVLGSEGFGYVRDTATGSYEQSPQIGRLIIEDDVEIGANSTIDRGALDETRIRRGTKIDNLVHIGHNVQIGENVVIAAQTGLSGSIVIEKGVVLGGQVGIGEHARIGEGVMLGGQGGVLPNKVLRGKGKAFWGTPAQPLREYLKQLATLARLAKKRRRPA